MLERYLQFTEPWNARSPMANQVGPNTSHREGYKMASAMPADSSENLQLSQRNDQNQPQLSETVPYSQKSESTVEEEHVARRKFCYTIVLRGCEWG